MRLIYIAGPLRAKTLWLREQNIRHAEEVALYLAKLGAMTFCPHVHGRHFEGELPEEFWLEGDKVILARCDAVVMLNNWKKSVGALGEYEFAARLALPIYREGDIESWRAMEKWISEAAQ